MAQPGIDGIRARCECDPLITDAASRRLAGVASRSRRHCREKQWARAVVPVRRLPFASGRPKVCARFSCPRMAAMLSNCSRFAPRVITRSSVFRAEVSTTRCSPLASSRRFLPRSLVRLVTLARPGCGINPRGCSPRLRIATPLKVREAPRHFSPRRRLHNTSRPDNILMIHAEPSSVNQTRNLPDHLDESQSSMSTWISRS